MPAIFSWQAFLIADASQPNVGALKMMKGASYEKPNNRASPDGNAPLSPPTAILPPEGEVCSTLALYFIFYE